MLSIKLICVGKLKEKYFADACAEYIKRLSAFCKLEIDEVAESALRNAPSDSEIELALEKEACVIETKLPKGAHVIAMCVEGRRFSSEDIAELFTKSTIGGISKLCFIIGGSFGLAERIKSKADAKMSMSEMTFPHHLARVMLLEQIYRGFKINEGGRYHK